MRDESEEEYAYPVPPVGLEQARADQVALKRILYRTVLPRALYFAAYLGLIVWAVLGHVYLGSRVFWTTIYQGPLLLACVLSLRIFGGRYIRKIASLDEIESELDSIQTRYEK